MNTRRLVLGASIATLVVCASISASTSSGVELPLRAGVLSPAAQAPRTLFGFREREQRRYIMGPPEALNEDEYAVWTIRLLAIEDDGGRFALTHERRDPASPSPLPRLRRDEIYEDPEYERSDGEVFVNLAGFPSWVRFQGHQRFHDRVFDYAAEYALRQGAFHWDLKNVLGEVYADVPLPDELDVDAELPAGLFLYYGGDMLCIGRGNTVQWLSDAYGLSERCHLGSLVFANPGLLSIALWTRSPEPGEQRDLWFLSPVGTKYEKGPPDMRGGRSARIADESELYARFRMEVLGERDIRLGERSVQTTELLLTELGRSVFVDADGRVVRVDLGLHPVSGRPRWIELVESIFPQR